MKTYRLTAAADAVRRIAVRTIGPSSALLLGLAPLAAAAAPGDVEVGKIKAETCMGCHGIPNHKNVYPTYSVPRVGGQHPDYIVLALKAYRNGERGHKTMQAQAASLSDQDMADIAAYFSSAPSR